jgi:hypothetical protein
VSRVRAWARSHGLPLAGCAALATALGWVIGAAPLAGLAGGPRLAAALLAAGCAAAAAIGLRALMAAARRSGGATRVASILLALGIVVAILMPGLSLLGGGRQSKLLAAGVGLGDLPDALRWAFLTSLIGLCALFAGESLVRAARRRSAGDGAPPPGVSRHDALATYLVLAAIAAAVVLLLPQGSREQALAERGTIEGQGLVALLRWSGPLAIALAILRRHFGRRSLVAVNVVLAALIVAQGVRSPLLLIGLAALARVLQALVERKVRLRLALPAVALGVYLGAALLVGLSTWRGEIIRDHPASLSGHLVEALASPVPKLQEVGGLDSLDGLLLTRRVEPAVVGASWTDPAKALTGFIPHQLWDGKPEWLSVAVTSHYLGWAAGGIFLSGFGYAGLVFGGWTGVAVLFLLLGAGAEAIYGRVRADSVAAVLLTYFLVRFFFNGDAFDAFHALGLYGLFRVAAAAGRIGSRAAAPASDPAAPAAPGLPASSPTSGWAQ